MEINDAKQHTFSRKQLDMKSHAWCARSAVTMVTSKHNIEKRVYKIFQE